MELKVVIACGGTGGHLFPGIAVGEAMRRRGHDVLALISEKHVDSVAARGHEDIRFEKLPAVGMPRLFSPRIVPFGFHFWRTLRLCRRVIREFGADAVLGMGGFTSMPPILAGRGMRAATFIHESNAYPGKANRLTARFATHVLVGLEDCAAHFPSAKTRVVGTPLRSALTVPADRGEALRHFGLRDGLKTLAVIGGSQGARGINNAVCRSLPDFDAGRIQVLHLTGEADFDFVRESYAKTSLAHHVAPFSHRMDFVFAVADLFVSRAGGSCLAELAYFGAPSILVPYPFAADDHQLKNAQVFSRQKAAVLMEERNLSASGFSKVVNNLMGDDETRANLGHKCKMLGRKDAAETIARIIEEACRG